MDVSDSSILSLVDERRASDVIPHLAGDHGEAEDDCQKAPHLFVVQKVQVVPAQIEEPSNEGRQHQNGNGGRVIRWPEDSYLDVGTLLDPLADNLGRHAHPLNVHGIGRFWLAFSREVNENRGCVQAQHLEHVGTLVKVDHRKEQLVRVGLRVPVGIGHYRVLIMGMPTDNTLPSRGHGSEHYDHRVIPWGRFDKVPETIPVEAHNRSFRVHVQQLLHLFRQGLRLKTKIRFILMSNSNSLQFGRRGIVTVK